MCVCCWSGCCGSYFFFLRELDLVGLCCLISYVSMQGWVIMRGTRSSVEFPMPRLIHRLVFVVWTSAHMYLMYVWFHMRFFSLWLGVVSYENCQRFSSCHLKAYTTKAYNILKESFCVSAGISLLKKSAKKLPNNLRLP